MFECKELPNVFASLPGCCGTSNGDDDVIDNKKEATKPEATKGGRPKARKVLTQDTMDQANDWNKFMATKGFIDVQYVLDDTGNVIAAEGSKNGLTSTVDLTLRKMLEG